jgi:hypothetical protein
MDAPWRKVDLYFVKGGKSNAAVENHVCDKTGYKKAPVFAGAS